ncbi:hypothetical protein OF83DRAFT_1179802 [Amylostereum chailletii]|nr:hypothetical protein OF83DRAFT_1179802 [Amylostereum chailletii]
MSAHDLATFVTGRWANDEMLNAGLDWIIGQLGPNSSTCIANCYFIPSLILGFNRGVPSFKRSLSTSTAITGQVYTLTSATSPTRIAMA